MDRNRQLSLLTALLSFSLHLFAQDNAALSVVSVLVKGANTATHTDACCRFSIAVPALAVTLVVSSMGYATQEVPDMAEQNIKRKSFNLYAFNIGLGPNTFLFRKFKDPAAANQFTPGNDYPLYKYSDLPLLYAEAESRVNNGPIPSAIERLNMVHHETSR